MDTQLSIRRKKEEICTELKKKGLTSNRLKLVYIVNSAFEIGEMQAKDIITATQAKHQESLKKVSDYFTKLIDDYNRVSDNDIQQKKLLLPKLKEAGEYYLETFLTYWSMMDELSACQDIEDVIKVMKLVVPVLSLDDKSKYIKTDAPELPQIKAIKDNIRDLQVAKLNAKCKNGPKIQRTFTNYTNNTKPKYLHPPSLFKKSNESHKNYISRRT